MNYVEKLTAAETDYISERINSRFLKFYFKNNSAEFSKFCPGFRVNTFSEEKAKALAVKNKNAPFIQNFFNMQINMWLREISEAKEKELAENGNEQTALVSTLSKSVFSENIELYFKLQGKDVSQEYISLCESYVNAITDFEKSAEENKKETKKKTDEETENLLKEHIKKEETLIKECEEKEEKLLKLQTEIEELNSKNKNINNALEKLQKRESKEVNSVKFEHRKDYPYTSLCKVYVSSHDGSKKLRRISDIENGTILDQCSNEIPDYKSLFLTSDTGSSFETDFVGIWDWGVKPNYNDPSKDFIKTSFSSVYSPVEIIFINNCSDEKELIKILNQGCEAEIHSDTIMFLFKNKENSKLEGIICKDTELEKSEGKYFLDTSVIVLPFYSVSKYKILEFNDMYFYNSINIGLPEKLVKVKDDMEIVREAVIKRASWNALKQKGYLKSSYQDIKDFLAELPLKDLYDEITKACVCTDEEAVILIEKFKTAASDYIKAEDIEGDILASVISSNEKLIKLCKDALTEEWTEQSREKFKEFEAELQKITAEIEEKKLNSQEMDRRYSEKKEEYDNFATVLRKKETLAEEVEQKVQLRIEAAKKNAADFITEQAFMLPSQNDKSGTDEKEKAYVSGEKLPVNSIEEIENREDIVNIIENNLYQSGISEDYSRKFAAFLYSAYINKVHILLSGPNSQYIAQALSCALSGRTPGRINGQSFSVSDAEQIKKSEDKVIILENPFSSECLFLSEKLPEKYFIGINPYAEDLRIEPKGMFNYWLPVMTEYIADRKPQSDFYGCNMSEGYEEFQSGKLKKPYNSFFSALKISPFAKDMIQKVIFDMHIILNDEDIAADFLFALIPCAYITGKTEELEKQKEYSTLPKETEKIIDIYMGES